jgi:hypothetical protein
MATVDTFAPDFPHGSPQGYYDGCKTNPPCANFGSDEWLTCKEAFANRSTDFSASKLPLGQKIPRPQAEKPAAPKPRPSKPLTVEPVVDVYEELLTEAGKAFSDALDSALAEPTFQQPLVDPHPTMTDKEKRGHYSKGCRLQPCKDAVTKAAREKREEKKRLEALEAQSATATEAPAAAPDADETYLIEQELDAQIVADAGEPQPYSLAGDLRAQIAATEAHAAAENAGTEVTLEPGEIIRPLADILPKIAALAEGGAVTGSDKLVEGENGSPWHTDPAKHPEYEALLDAARRDRDQALDAAFALRTEIATENQRVATLRRQIVELTTERDRLKERLAFEIAREAQRSTAAPEATTVSAAGVTITITVGSN